MINISRIIQIIKKFYKRINYYHLSFLLFLTIIFFSVLITNVPRYNNIRKITDTIYLKGGFNVTQNYKLDNPKPIEEILSIFINRIQYGQICFRDDDSRIKIEPLKGSPLSVIVEYNNQQEEIAFISNNNRTDFSTQQCFSIINDNINWTLKFDSTNDITSSFVRDIPEATISPNVSVYLKVSDIYYIGLFLLTFLYSGLFCIAILEILKFISK